ncbi:MAG: hypothetical protein F2946_04635 [Actinobacteria bacterium]|nr:hypothetical protein [Actinomycetota bacterium]
MSAPRNGHLDGRRRSDGYGLELGSHGAGGGVGAALWSWAVAMDVPGLHLWVLGGADLGLPALEAL